MNLRNKAILGATVLLGGSVLLYATVNQIMNETKNTNPDKVVINQPVQNEKIEQPLTADIEVEKNILAQKRKEREQQVQQQERQAEKYLTEQQRVEAEALARTRAENQLYVKEEEIARPVITPRPKNYLHHAEGLTDAEKKTIEKPKTVVVVQKPKQNPSTTTQKSSEIANKTETLASKQAKLDKKSDNAQRQPEQKVLIANKNKEKEIENRTRPSHYQVQKGEGLIQLSRRYDVPVEILAKINNLDKNSNLHLGQKIIIPTEKQLKQSQKQLIQEQQKQQELAQKQQETAKLKEAEQKLKQARQSVKQNDAKGNFGVQIALATDQQKADAIVKQLQSAGYKAKTSQTTRGIRVVVGPEKGKEAALALKDKINADPKIKTNEAWVLFW